MIARPWTPEEDAYLRSHAASQTLLEMAAALHRRGGVIWNRLKRLGITERKNTPNVAWSKHEQFKLMTLSEKHGLSELVKLMGRSKHSIHSQARLMGIRLRSNVHSLNSACAATGYHYTQLVRARDALGQRWRWERFRGWGRYSIREKQFEALCEYLKTEGQQEAA